MNERPAVKQVPIGDVVEQVATWNPSRSPNGEFSYIDLSSVDQSSKKIIGTVRHRGVSAPSRARQLVANGDILVSTVRPNLNGVAKVPPELDGATASTGFCVLRPSQKKIDTNFLFHWVRSPSFVGRMVREATGASYPAVSDRIVKASTIPLPPLDEQRRIAAILDKADALRRKRKRALDLLQEQRDTLFENIYRSAKSELKEICLADVARAGSGNFGNGPFGSDLLTSELQDTGVPVIYIRDIRGARYKRVSKSHVSEAKSQALKSSQVKPGDLLISKVGDPPGIAAVYPKGAPDAIITQDVIRLRVNDDVADAIFLEAMLNSSIGRHWISRITVAATRARFSLRDLKNLRIRVPSVPKQKELSSIIANLEAVRTKMVESEEQQEKLFSSLQSRAFAGEL